MIKSLELRFQKLRDENNLIRKTEGILGNSSTGLDCDPDFSGYPNCTSPQTVSKYIGNIPGYGNCRALVEYELVVCFRIINNRLETVFFFNKFTAKPEASQDCQNLIDYWRTLAANNQLNQLKIEMDAFINAAKEKLEDDELSVPVIEYKSFYDCDEPNRYLASSSFYKSHCYRYCINTSGGGFTFYQNACTEVCCNTITQYCWDFSTNSLRREVVDISETGSCNDVVIACASGYTSAGDCFHNCIP